MRRDNHRKGDRDVVRQGIFAVTQRPQYLPGNTRRGGRKETPKPEAILKWANTPNNQGRCPLTGPGRIENVDLNPYRSARRFQELVFELARDLTRDYTKQSRCIIPAHVLFPQIAKIVDKYLKEKVLPIPPADRKSVV